mmetsp:Transcript_18592/g.28944  ORF Transcript_18592/g.28944 Transcript_18592/m.28944 type:complete len:415 (-) Transcript_18592:574-1818(-)|eukprot:CAMPEP_0184323682 /NCGR_PEP_ID=MMETSP1049-20130417/131557_1 /TAXON_ID=77928 /ORGANISM="Proteomonas sulcata, Strain CCMP704" /LENGTH=414 /DNA_ID=CAMNT_0026645245 /DNA_START=110 /DNA_END=1354 /DNA_ORIENTATION=+
MAFVSSGPALWPSPAAGALQAIPSHEPFLSTCRRSRPFKSAAESSLQGRSRVWEEQRTDRSGQAAGRPSLDPESDGGQSNTEQLSAAGISIQRVGRWLGRGCLVGAAVLSLVVLPHPEPASANPVGLGHGAGAVTTEGINRQWAELKGKERAAAQMLGFNQELWDNDGKIPIDQLTWDQLSELQKRSATVLHFNKKMWDDELFVDVYERPWTELTQEQRDAAKELGFKKPSLWDNDKHVFSDDLYWKDLNKKQRAAAGILGYSQPEWDESHHVYDKQWKQLSTSQVDAAKILGFSEKTWNNDRTVWSDSKYWKDLKDKERRAAKTIGYNELTWDRGTKLGLHATDAELQRVKKMRADAIEKERKKKGKDDSCKGFGGPFSFSRKSCGRGKPYYVPTFMGAERHHDWSVFNTGTY